MARVLLKLDSAERNVGFQQLVYLKKIPGELESSLIKERNSVTLGLREHDPLCIFAYLTVLCIAFCVLTLCSILDIDPFFPKF